REALRLQPDYPEAYNILGAILFSLGKFAEAEKAARKAIASQPDRPEAYTNLGAILHNQGRLPESEAALKQAIALKPSYAEAHKNLGVVLKNQGKLAEAEAAFREAIACEPGYAEVFKHLGELKKYSDTDAQQRDGGALGDIAAMEKLISQSGTSSEESMNLYFALGKAYEDIGNYDRAFDYFTKGNQMKRQSLKFDIANIESYVKRTIEVFTKSLFAQYGKVGLASDLPILIVGMPRSGTTLVEQILASHPQVHGAGELPYLNQLTNKLARALSVEVKGAKLPFPESLTKINASKQLRKAGELYIKSLRKHDADARYITDKMPDNCFRIGLLHLILPQVKIIHCLRNPADTCLSCYQKLFAQGQNFSYDLKDLGRYYQLYHRLMQHWHTVLPGHILEVQYEDVVASQEKKAREILEFCGIAWDDACLNFHQTDRTVKTASAAQVRQPIYTTSVQRWRRYEKQLAPLLEALGPLAPVVE
ncbi:MAG: sulfotransferase, partial [Hormoscilla sp.]